MATNGILDITTEEYMGQDPEMQIDQDEMIEIIRTLQVIGIPQDKHPEVLEAFKEWKQTNAGTVDMFLEASLQLEPGTITKIKEQQVARGPEDIMQTEEEMIIQPGSPDMQEIMQSVGAPQRAAQGGRIGFANGSRDPKDMTTQELIAVVQEGYSTPEIFIELQKRLPKGIEQLDLTEMGLEGDQAFRMNQNILSNYNPNNPAVEEEFLYDLRENNPDVYNNYKRPRKFYGYLDKPVMAQGGRIGYQAGEQVLPMPRPTEEDSRLEFFKRMGAMPEQTLLRQPQSMNAMRGQMGGQGIMGQTPDPFGGLLGGEEGDIGIGGQPLVEYEHEGAEQPPSWWDRMRTGTHDAGVAHTPDIDMQMIIDFLKKMGMAINQENIAKAAKALGMAMKFGPMGVGAGLGIAGLQSLGAPEEIEETETETIGFRDGGITNAVPRQGFFIGKAVKAITGGAKKVLKSAKKILKSDLGKMAMMYIATAGFSNVAAQQGLGGAQKWGGFKWLQPGNVGRNISSAVSRVIPASWKNVKEVTDVADGKGIIDWGAINATNQADIAALGDLSLGGATTGSTLGTTLAKAPKPWYKGALPWIGAASLAGGAYTAANPGDVQFDTGKRDEEVNKWTQWLAQIPPADDIVYPYPNYTGAQGGRVGRQEGGIMDLGGAEKDYRNTGGFVDIGAKEKADDVPARLSVNEFVMTADAVRGAGDGDVEEGAERLQDTMKQLEQKGKRHKAAQGMFATSQRLGEVI